MTLLEVKGLTTQFPADGGGVVRAVTDVDLSLERGEILAVVGESGSGKSVMSLSLMRLIAAPGRIVRGEISLAVDDRVSDLMKLSEKAMAELRGNKISMVFQDPMTSLNPYLSICRQLTEVLETHRKFSSADAKRSAIEMLDSVGIPDPGRRIDDYPHQLSGGMRQRVVLAMALLCRPSVLIADEPTTALDVTIQAQILELIDETRQRDKTGVILITHDLGVVARLADRVAVMYAGRIVEQGTVYNIFSNPHHPYTVGLSKAIPRLSDRRGERLLPILGSPPDLAAEITGCAFAPRCDRVIDTCRTDPPDLRAARDIKDHWVRCHRADTLTPSS